MTAQDKLNKAAQSHGWANWAEVLLHNAPAHVINLVVEDAMRTQQESKPDLKWRPGAKVRITGDSNNHGFEIGETVEVRWLTSMYKSWACYHLDGSDWHVVRESDAVVVG